MSKSYMLVLIIFLNTKIALGFNVESIVRMKGYLRDVPGHPILNKTQLERGLFNVTTKIITIDLSVSTYISTVQIQKTTTQSITVTGNFYTVTENKTKQCEAREQFNQVTYSCHDTFRDLMLTGNDVRYFDLRISGHSIRTTEYMGCFRLIKDRPSVVSARCGHACSLNYVGYNQAGKCFCVSTLENLRPDYLGNCQSRCTNIYSVRCGNGSTFSVYYTGEKLVYAKRTIDCYHNFTTECQSCPLNRKGSNCEIFGCARDVRSCDENMVCQSEHVSSYLIGICQCHQGYYRKNFTECEDIDECRLKIHECDAVTGYCTNRIGTYICLCRTGYMWLNDSRHVCTDIDECLTNSCGNETTATCSNTIGTFSCTCKPGYFNSTPTTCLDIDECSTNPCGDESIAICWNLPGSFNCTCKPGYFRNLSTAMCLDIDECLTNPCTNARKCLNKIGNFECDCFSGFEFIEREKDCKDMDECLVEQLCDSNTTSCLNTPGSYLCDCNLGFLRFTSIKCSDIDECDSFVNTCGEKSVCRNTYGTFVCECPEGSISNKFEYLSECEDIDECAGVHECVTEESFCLNLHFGYYCQCRTGYINIDNHTCEINHIWNMTTPYSEEDFITTGSTPKIHLFLLLILLSVLGLIILTLMCYIVYGVFMWRRMDTRESSTLSNVSAASVTTR